MRWDAKAKWITSDIMTARDSGDMKTDLPCVPNVPSVENQLPVNTTFQVAQFQTSNYPTFCGVFQTSLAGMFSGGEAFLEVKLDLCLKVVSLGLDMVLKGAWGGSFNGGSRSWVWWRWSGNLLHWATCHWSRKASPPIVHNTSASTVSPHLPWSARLCRLIAIRTISEHRQHRTYLTRYTKKLLVELARSIANLA